MRRAVVATFVVCLMLGGTGLVRADDQADMKALIDKAVKAMGGAEKLAKFKGATSKGKGTIHGPNSLPFTEESSAALPDRYRFDIELDVNGTKIKELIILNDDKGWLQINGQTVDLPPEVAGVFRDSFYAMQLAIVPLDAGKADKLSPLGETKVGDRTALGVLVSRKGRRDVNLYFDKENGLPLKCETTARDTEKDQEVLHEFFYSDYKEFDGVKAFTKLLWKKDGKDYVERELAEIKPQEKVDENLFAKP